MKRRQHDRLIRPGRRQSDRRPAAADRRRVMLVGTDEAWRLRSAYMFEEAGYVVYAATTPQQAAAFTRRLLPDVVVLEVDVPYALAVLARLAAESSTHDIPVVVLTGSLHSPAAHRARAAGGVTLLPNDHEVETLIGEVDTLSTLEARVRRTLRRRLLDLQEIARFFTPDADGAARVRRFIDHLQVAVLAVDMRGECIAASEGATTLTGYSRLQLRTTVVFEAAFAGVPAADGCWRDFVAMRQTRGTTTITTRTGEAVRVYASGLAEVMPGVHVAAFALA